MYDRVERSQEEYTCEGRIFDYDSDYSLTIYSVLDIIATPTTEVVRPQNQATNAPVGHVSVLRPHSAGCHFGRLNVAHSHDSVSLLPPRLVNFARLIHVFLATRLFKLNPFPT
jgi:hypothetical protein